MNWGQGGLRGLWLRKIPIVRELWPVIAACERVKRSSNLEDIVSIRKRLNIFTLLCQQLRLKCPTPFMPSRHRPTLMS